MHEPQYGDATGAASRRPETGGERRPLALVLHDDPRMLGHVHALVAAEGLDALTVADAFGLLEPHDRDVALIVVGVTALDETALDDFTLTCERHPDATLLVLYPQNLRERAAHALAAGADATLPEPFYPGERAAHAQRALERRAASTGRQSAQDADAQNADAPAPIPRPLDVGRDFDAARPAAPDVLRDDERTPVEQLAKGISHCINQPLTILELMLGGAESGDALDPEAVREQLDRIQRVALDLTRLSSRTRIERVVVDLNSLVREVFPTGTRRSGPRFDLDLADDGLTVRGEPEMLRQALELVRDRAARLTPRGQPVRVVTRRVGAEIELAVSDSGPTLPRDALARFFQPAPDDDAAIAGTWLEMAVFAGIVRNHGGATSVRAGDDNGVTVTVRIPGARVTAAAR